MKISDTIKELEAAKEKIGDVDCDFERDEFFTSVMYNTCSKLVDVNLSLSPGEDYCNNTEKDLLKRFERKLQLLEYEYWENFSVKLVFDFHCKAKKSCIRIYNLKNKLCVFAFFDDEILHRPLFDIDRGLKRIIRQMEEFDYEQRRKDKSC